VSGAADTGVWVGLLRHGRVGGAAETGVCGRVGCYSDGQGSLGFRRAPALAVSDLCE